MLIGTADPPLTTALRLERSNFSSVRERKSSSPTQMVGTPRLMDTRCSLIRRQMEAGSGRTPVKTWVAPVMVAEYGTPQLLAWNIGTTAITTSRSRTPAASALHSIMA